MVLNIEEDHLDYFKDLNAIEHSFHQFAEMATAGILANGDDKNTLDALKDLEYVTFGLDAKDRIHGENYSKDWREFDVICDGKRYCHLKLQVVGRHNALNALAAAGTAWMLGLPSEAVENGLAKFTGAGRRMERKGSFNGADVYDDYAHHPGELAATIDAVRMMGYERVVVAFQPHTYSRTKALFNDFVRELQKPDLVVLAEIYAARERNTTGISSTDLAKEIPGAVYCETLPQVTAYLQSIARPGDVILTIGAGDIYRAGEALVK